MSSKVILIVAIDNMWCIGRGGKIPWNCPKDRKFFRETTSNVRDASKINAVIMGRKTFEECGVLKNRKNVVISRRVCTDVGVESFSSVKDAVNNLKKDPVIETIFICGGREIYKDAMKNDLVDIAYVSRIGEEYMLLPKLEYEVVFFPLKELLKYFIEIKPFNAISDFQVVEFKKFEI